MESKEILELKKEIIELKIKLVELQLELAKNREGKDFKEWIEEKSPVYIPYPIYPTYPDVYPPYPRITYRYKEWCDDDTTTTGGSYVYKV